MIKLFGITGYRLSGKSLVAGFIKKHNIPVINIDDLFVDIFAPGHPVHRKIITYISDDILNESDASVNMNKLSLLLCKEPWVKEFIDDILDTEIDEFIYKMTVCFENHQLDFAGIESNMLMNSKMMNYIKTIIFVNASKDNRYNRMKNTLPNNIIDNIFKMECDMDFSGIDYFINNNGTINELQLETMGILKKLIIPHNQ